MSGKFVTLCAVGLLGSLFIGYCVYFDKKRRSDPDYKKKVVASKFVDNANLSRSLAPPLLVVYLNAVVVHWEIYIYIYLYIYFTPCSDCAGRRMKRLAAKENLVNIDLRDPKVREEFLMSEIMKANQRMAEGWSD